MTNPKYNWEHQKLRAQWVPLIAKGGVLCRRASNGTCRAADQHIEPGMAWQLGHPDETCPAPTAPEHLTCNGSTMTRERRAARLVRRRSRIW